MEAVPVAFLPRSVYEQRLTTIRSYLADNDLEALVVLTNDNFYFIANFFLDVAPWERPVAAVIPRNAEPFLVMHELSQNHLRMAQEIGMLWIPDWDFYVEHPRQVNRRWLTPQWTALLAEKLESRGIRRGRLGVEGPIGSIKPLLNYLPKLEFEDATPFLRRMRRVKCEEELEFVRCAADITEFGMEALRRNVKPGRMIREVDYQCWTEMAGYAGAKYPDAAIQFMGFSLTGPSSAAPHGEPGNFGRKVEYGDVIVNMTCARFNGLVCENERTFIVGEPQSDLVVRAFNAAAAACIAAGEAAVTGNRVSDIDAAAQKIIEDAGFGDNIVHRTGHGVGIAGHEWPDDTAFNCRKLETNEVFSAEPGIYIYGVGGFRHDDTAIVKPGKSEIVTHTARSLEDQIIRV